jgi:hypothetical protein
VKKIAGSRMEINPCEGEEEETTTYITFGDPFPAWLDRPDRPKLSDDAAKLLPVVRDLYARRLSSIYIPTVVRILRGMPVTPASEEELCDLVDEFLNAEYLEFIATDDGIGLRATDALFDRAISMGLIDRGRQ